MTLSEFKAWFEGFTEDMDGAPSEKQWKRIKARVKEITGQATTYPVFVDRYVRDKPWWVNSPYEPYRVYSAGACKQDVGNAVLMSQGDARAQHLGAASAQNMGQYDSHKAMASLGKAEYASL